MERKLILGLLSAILVLMTVLAVVAAPAKKIPILVAGPPAQWFVYPAVLATSELITRKTNLELTVRSYGGALAIVQAVIAKEASIGSGPKDSSWAQAYGAYGDFTGKQAQKNLRATVVYNSFIDILMVPAKTNIKSVADLKGKKVAWFTNESNEWTQALLRVNGLDSDKDIVKVPVGSYSEAVREIIMGRIDAAELAPAQPTAMELSEAVGPLRLLPVPPDKFARLQKEYPKLFGGATQIYIKKGYMPHIEIKEPTPTYVFPVTVCTREDVSEDIIYNYTKAWLNNIDQIKALAEALKEFGPDMIKTPSAMPYHNGAIKALKEAGMWTDEMQKVHNAALSR